MSKITKRKKSLLHHYCNVCLEGEVLYHRAVVSSTKSELQLEHIFPRNLTYNNFLESFSHSAPLSSRTQRQTNTAADKVPYTWGAHHKQTNKMFLEFVQHCNFNCLILKCIWDQNKMRNKYESMSLYCSLSCVYQDRTCVNARENLMTSEVHLSVCKNRVIFMLWNA